MSATVITLLPILPSYNTHLGERLSSIAQSVQSDLLRNIDEDLDHDLMVTSQSQELQTKSYIAGSVEYVDLGIETKHLTGPLELIYLNRETINMIDSVQYISLNQKSMDKTGSLDYVSMTITNFAHNLSVPVTHSVTSEEIASSQGPTLHTGDDITADIITHIRGTRVFDTTHNSISTKQLPASSTEQPHTISSLSLFQSSTVRYRLCSCPYNFRSADSKRVNKRSSEYVVRPQLPEKTSRVELNLVLEKSGLSQYKRKRSCAYDPRFSCQVTAVASLTILLLIVTILVVSDMPALYRQSPLRVLCQTTGDNRNHSYQDLSKGV